MKIHPLHVLGFKAVAAATRKPSDAATVTVGEPVEQKPAPVPSNPSGVIVKGAMTKGSRVRMADGTLGKVVYVDGQLRFVRIRTEDGRNLTVRRKDFPL